MEARLAVALAASAASPVSFSPLSPRVDAGPVAAVGASPTESAVKAEAPASAEEPASAWPDEAAESAFRAEARERGEAVKPVQASEVPEVIDPKTLPSLDSLVQRIPTPVRESLEDLFRARFVKVDRVPAKSLKG